MDTMPEHPPDPFIALKARSQEALIEFLNSDLDLAFTFLQTAKIEAGSDAVQCNAALEKVRIALESIRGFQARVEDFGQRTEIHRRVNELESALNALLNSN